MYVLYLNRNGGHDGYIKLSESTLDGVELDADDHFGLNVTNLGDRDGDGVQDIAVGAWLDDDTATNKGAIYMIQIDEPNAPGGITPRAWFDASLGVTLEGTVYGDPDIRAWNDISENGFTLDQNTSTAYHPRWIQGVFNGYPALEFDGSDERLGTNQSVLETGSNGTVLIIASNDDNAGSTFETLAGFGDADGNDPLIGVNITSQTLFSVYEDDSTPTSVTHNQVSLLTGETYLFDAGWVTGTDTTLNLGVNGIDDPDNNMDITDVEAGFAIGGANTDLLEEWDGYIAEVVVFDSYLTGTDLTKVRSYLATKYGITLNTGNTDYLDSSGSVIWSTTNNAGYGNDIAGIGRDDRSNLMHTRSRSVEADAMVTMFLRSDATGLDDKEFMYWSNDDATITGTSTSNLPSYAAIRNERIWKIDEIGTIGAVDVQIDMTQTAIYDPTALNYYLLVDTDTNFSDATVYTGRDIGGGQVTFTQIDFADGATFAVARGTKIASAGALQTDLTKKISNSTG